MNVIIILLAGVIGYLLLFTVLFSWMLTRVEKAIKKLSKKSKKQAKVTKKPLYTCVLVNDIEALKRRYAPIHKNLFYHHMTIEFNPSDISNFVEGVTVRLTVIGRYTSELIDALIVIPDYNSTTKLMQHITLSTAEGISPVRSKIELENQDVERFT